MAETLPECGHCGGPGYVYEEWPDCGSRPICFYVGCTQCDAESRHCDTREAAIAAWTRRWSRMPDGSVYVVDPMGEGLVNCYVIPPKEKQDG